MAGDLGATLGAEGWTVPGTAGSTTNLQTAAEMGESLGGSGWSVPGTAGDVANLGTGGNINAQLTAQGWDVRFDSPPTFALDFARDPYATLHPAFSHVRATASTLIQQYDGSYVQMLPNEFGLDGGRRLRNLLNNTDTLATQGVTVEAADYWLSFTGTGSVAVSGVATGSLAGTGVSDRVSKKITAGAAGTMTLTVTGSVTSAMLTKSRVGQSIADPEYVSRGVEILGAEQVTNGDFSDGLTGWTVNAGTGSVAVVDGRARMSTVDVSDVMIQTSFVAQAGREYRITITQYGAIGGGASIMLVGKTPGAVDYVNTSLAGDQTYSGTFTANASGVVYIQVLQYATGPAYADLDNISVKPILHHGWGVDGVRWFGTGPNGEDLTDPASGFPVLCDGLATRRQVTNLAWPSESFSGQAITVTSGQPYTISFYGTGSIAYSGAASGTLVGTGVDERVSVTITTTTTTLTLASPTGTVSKVQVEAGSVANAHVPTTTSSATADGDAFPHDIAEIGGTAGTWIVEHTPTQSPAVESGNQTLLDLYADANNRARVYNPSGNLGVQVVDGGVSQWAGSDAGANWTAGTLQRLAVRFETDDGSLVTDGDEHLSDVSMSVPDATVAYIGGDASSKYSGSIARIAYYGGA